MPTIDLPEVETFSIDALDIRKGSTHSAVRWRKIAARICKSQDPVVKSCQWRDEADTGGDNLVRWLVLHDASNTTLAVRVPLLPMEGRTRDDMKAICKRMTSEIDTMEYVRVRTNIPIPQVVYHSIRFDNEAEYPYVVLSHIQGVKLNEVWDKMSDENRHDVLGQLADITLHLWTRRFPKAGVLVKRKNSTVVNRSAFMVKAECEIAMSHDIPDRYGLQTTNLPTATAYWQKYANASFRALKNACYAGFESRPFAFAERWFMRSLVPSLFDPILDSFGFPLAYPYRMDNILIDDTGSSPVITGLLDWEFSGPTYSSSFARYPTFILDAQNNDPDVLSRNAKDRSAYHGILTAREEQYHRDFPEHFPLLSKLVSDSPRLHLFQQCLLTPSEDLDYFYPLLYQHIHNSEQSSAEPNDDVESKMAALHQELENGLLKNCLARVAKERAARAEMQINLQPEEEPAPFTTAGQRLYLDVEDNVILDLTSGEQVPEWSDSLLGNA